MAAVGKGVGFSLCKSFQGAIFVSGSSVTSLPLLTKEDCGDKTAVDPLIHHIHGHGPETATAYCTIWQAARHLPLPLPSPPERPHSIHGFLSRHCIRHMLGNLGTTKHTLKKVVMMSTAEYPLFNNAFSFFCADANCPAKQNCTSSSTITGCGWSQT